MSGPRHRSRAGAGAGSPLELLAAAERVARAGIVACAPAAPADPSTLRDARGYRMTAAMQPGYRRGAEPANKGKRYPPDPPTVEECFAMLNACPATPHGRRLFAAIIFMWQGALRAAEALDLTEADLEQSAGLLHIRHGKGNKQATITMASWAWPYLNEWRTLRRDLPKPSGPLLCIISGPTAGRAWAYSDLNHALKKIARAAGVERRVSCHQLRHAFSSHGYTAGLDIRTIQLHLRHSNLGITDTYLRGLGLDESRRHVYELAVPTVPATALLELGAARQEPAHV